MTEKRSDTILAAALGIVVFGTYAVCLSTYPASWDSAELQVVAYILGIPHPTGFPIYILAGWLVTHGLPVSSVAWRMNALSAFCTTVATIAIFWSARSLGANRFSSVLGALTYCAGAVVVGRGTHTDVHAMSTMWFALLVASLLRYVTTRTMQALYLGMLCEGLGLATHPTAVWWAPAIVVAIGFSAPDFPRRRDFAISAALVAVPLLAYLYLPLRSYTAVDPNAFLDLGPDYASFVDSNRPSTWAGFVREVSGSDFGAFGTLSAIVNVRRYFEYASYYSGAALDEFGFLGLALASLGALVILRRSRAAFVVLAVAGFAGVPFAVAFAYAEGDVQRYFLPSFVVISIGISLAPIALRRAPVKAALQILQLVVLVALVRSNWQGAFDERLDVGGAPSIEAMIHDTPPNATIVCLWGDGTSLAYASYVEGRFAERHIVISWPGALRKLYPRMSKFGPLYVLVPNGYENQVTDALPAQWYSEIPTTAPGHSLYVMCRDRGACRI